MHSCADVIKWGHAQKCVMKIKKKKMTTVPVVLVGNRKFQRPQTKSKWPEANEDEDRDSTLNKSTNSLLTSE